MGLYDLYGNNYVKLFTIKDFVNAILSTIAIIHTIMLFA